MSILCYHIVEWNERYENNKTRHLQVMRWVAVPNSQDTNGMQHILKCSNGLFVFGFWILTLQLASRCYPRGYLISGRGENAHPYTIEELAVKYNISVEQAQEAMNILLSKEVGWIEQIEYASIGNIPIKNIASSALSHFDTPTLALLLRLGHIYGRNNLDAWTDDEKEIAMRLIASKQLTDTNVRLIEKYFKQKIKPEYDFRPKSLASLLINFRKQVDKAYIINQQHKKS